MFKNVTKTRARKWTIVKEHLFLNILPYNYTATLTLIFSLGAVLWRGKELVLAPSVPDVDNLQNGVYTSGKISVAYGRLSWFDFFRLCHLNRQPETRSTVSRRTTTTELSIPARAPELIVQPRAPHSLWIAKVNGEEWFIDFQTQTFSALSSVCKNPFSSLSSFMSKLFATYNVLATYHHCQLFQFFHPLGLNQS